MKEMTVLAVIPARGGSKGIPGKNIRDLLGKPLIAYTIEAALRSQHLNRVIVSTDDETIAEIARKYGAEVPFIRPGRLAGDNVPMIPHVPRHAVEELERSGGFKVDVVVMLQPTVPLRGTRYIDLAIEKLIQTKCDWVATVSRVNLHPFRMRRMEGDRLLPLFPDENIWAQRQDFPPLYHVNGAVYATWKRVIVMEEVFRDRDWRGVIMDEEDAMDIDTLTDFLVAESIMRKRTGNAD